MNRTQKKCFIAVTGFHLLLIVILFVGPAFLSPDKADDMTVIDFIPARLIDAPFTGGGSPTANPPTPTPPAPAPVQRQQQTQPSPPVTKPPPQVEKIEKQEPAKDLKPDDKPSKPQVSTTLVTRTASKPTDKKQSTAKPDSQSTKNPSKEFKEAARHIREGASSSTEIEMPGISGGGEAYANYAQVVKSIYTQAWIAPDGVEDDEATAKITVTIARDGTVVSARIIQSSGNADVDRSVQGTLDRVKFIAPFPEGSRDAERSYKINFNLKAKKLLG